MAKTLQQIKDQVASECGWDLWTSLYTDGKVTNGMIAQVAIRYAEEQNQEMLEMLKRVVEIQEKYFGDGAKTQLALRKIAIEAEQLITKHKQS